MNTIRIHPFWLLVAFAAGLFVYHIIAAQRQTSYALAGIDSRLTRLEERNLEIEAQKEKRQSRLVWAGYILQFAGLICQLLGKLRFW